MSKHRGSRNGRKRKTQNAYHESSLYGWRLKESQSSDASMAVQIVEALMKVFSPEDLERMWLKGEETRRLQAERDWLIEKNRRLNEELKRQKKKWPEEGF